MNDEFDDDLRHCPQCKEDMRAGDTLCHRCQAQDDIDNMTEADYRVAAQYMPSSTFDPKLSESAFAARGNTEIHWVKSDPERAVRFKALGESMGDYQESPFKGAQFDGWDSGDVAQYIDDWRQEEGAASQP